MGEVKATNDEGNNGTINVTKKIILKGTGIDTKLNANSNNTSLQHNIFTVKDGGELTLENLTLTNSKGNAGTFGGAILVTSGSNTAELTDCVIEDCTADNGGAIGCSKNSTVKLTNTTIKKCTAHKDDDVGSGGAIFATGSSVELTNCTITGNKAEKDGGGIYAQKDGTTPSTVTILGGFIGKKDDGDHGNTTTGLYGIGGAIYVGEDCTLTLNEYTDGSGTAQGVQLIGNSATLGGGVYAGEKATANITNCTLMNNGAGRNGGGVYGSESQITIKSCTLMSNEAELGGGIYTYKGRLTMTSCTLIGNRGYTSGGGMTINNGIADIKNCSLRGNTAFFGGGAIEVRKDDTSSKVTISGGIIGGDGTNANTATNSGYSLGGGIYVSENCTLTLNNYTPEGSGTAQGVQLIGNTAVTAGGGVYVSNHGTLKMKGSACVTPSTGEDVNKPGKNDVYLEDDTKITVDGELSPAGGTAARITVADGQYDPSTQVLDGDITKGTAPNQNYRKFTVTPNSGQMWYVDRNGKLTTTSP